MKTLLTAAILTAFLLIALAMQKAQRDYALHERAIKNNTIAYTKLHKENQQLRAKLNDALSSNSMLADMLADLIEREEKKTPLRATPIDSGAITGEVDD